MVLKQRAQTAEQLVSPKPKKQTVDRRLESYSTLNSRRPTSARLWGSLLAPTGKLTVHSQSFFHKADVLPLRFPYRWALLTQSNPV